MSAHTSAAAPIDKSQTSVTDLGASAAVAIELSPPLVLAAALLYMMLSNGEVEKTEIDQLQSVIGKNADLLRCAVDYVRSVPVEQFIEDARDILKAPDKLSVLTNMCDAMLSDGQADAVEMSLLAQLAEAFGLSDEEFQPYFEAIALKNDNTVLGAFDVEKLASQQATPHLALAASLIYMMASDGSLGPEEIGRLQAMIGQFEGLQKVAVKYALKVKSQSFFVSASKFLNVEQKLFILTNVCDIMLADGVVEDSEQAIFDTMRTSFGYTKEDFEPYHLAITAKNVRTFDTHSFTYARDSRLPDEVGADDIFGNAGVSFSASVSRNLSVKDGAQPKFGTSVSRTMRANIVRVSTDFGSAKKLGRISDNSHLFGDKAPEASNETSTVTYKPRQDERVRVPPAGNASSPGSARRPFSIKGNRPALDPTGHDAEQHSPPMDQELEAEGVLAETHETLSAVVKSPKRARPRRPRRPATRAPGEGLVQHAQAVAELEEVRDRLKNTQVITAELRQQLDQYEATGKMVRMPMGFKAISRYTPVAPLPEPQAALQLATVEAPPQASESQMPNGADQTQDSVQTSLDETGKTAIAQKLSAAESDTVQHHPDAAGRGLDSVANSLEASEAPPQEQKETSTPAAEADLAPFVTPNLPKWRIVATVAVLAGVLMGGAGSIFTGLWTPQPTPVWTEAPSNTASLGECLVGHALSKQSWFPRAASGCWSVPQPQSATAALAVVGRKIPNARFL